MDSSNRLKGFSPHDKVKDRIEELFGYFNSFMADLTEMREFYATQDDNKTLGDDILERGVALVADTNRMLIMYNIDKQIASRMSSLEEPLDLKNIIAGLESEICRLLKIKEELAEETIRGIDELVKRAFTSKIQHIAAGLIKEYAPQFDLDTRLDEMAVARTARQPR